MSHSQAYPITYGVLGLLAFWGPMTGYDIKRMFDHVLSPVWSAAHSQVYKELRRMKYLGWAEMEVEEQESRPDRKVYHITEEGRKALAEWQGQRAEVFQLHDELLLKMLFGSVATTEQLEKHITDSINQHEQRLATYRQNMQYIFEHRSISDGMQRHNPYAQESEEDPFMGLLNHFAIDFEKTYLRWLNETLQFVKNRELPEETV
jgi:PadR family transcriptional regulator, regulatory protein AphA